MYQYDANGNTRSITEEDQVVQMSYDGDDRLISVVTEEKGQVTSTVSYGYDADGNRVQTLLNGEVTQYVVDSFDSLAQVIAELDKDDQVKVAYLHGDDLISQYRENDIHYYHYDGLGSTRGLTDQNATVTDAYNYEAFGELLEQTGETENNYLYTGEQIDPNTGNYYLRARYYNPASGRFLSMDSFDGLAQEPVTLHKYLYANADPVNFVDPSGYFSLGSVSAGNTVRGILNTMNRIDNTLEIFNFVTDPTGAITDKLTDKALGALVLSSRLGNQGPHLLRLFSRTCRINSSFTAGTLVHTKRGLVPIEEIQIDEQVLSYDEKTHQRQWNAVVNLIQGQQEYTIVTLYLENGETIEATAEHLFYLKDKGWNPASSLKARQSLLLRNDVTVLIKEIDTGVRFEKVYNFTIANAHTYYISEDGVLVHNTKKNNHFNCGKVVPKPGFELIIPGSKKWDAAVQQLQSGQLGHGQNFRVETQRQARQLLEFGLPNLPRYKQYKGSIERGWEYHVAPEGVNDNALHIKWWINPDGIRKGQGSREGHIFFDVWM